MVGTFWLALVSGRVVPLSAIHTAAIVVEMLAERSASTEDITPFGAGRYVVG